MYRETQKRIREKQITKENGSGIISSLSNGTAKILNKTIDYLSIQFRLPGNQFCGPGTKLEKRSKRGDPVVNELDKTC